MAQEGYRMSVRWIFDKLSPAGPDARLTILIFHRVLPTPDPLFPGEPDAAWFETQMQWIKDWFNVLPLAEAIECLRSQSLPARAAAITFDDGYADNCTVALPILRRAGLSATFFVATGYLNGGQMWNDTVIDVVRRAKGPRLDLSQLQLGDHLVATLDDRRRALEQLLNAIKYMVPAQRERLVGDLAADAGIAPSRELMLTSHQVRTLADSGMTIGAHTVSHPILARVDEKQARTEMIQSKLRLEAITGRKVDLFAYPNGKPDTDYTMTHVRLVREAGFSAAVSTGWGTATARGDIFQLPRFTPWDRTALRYALRLARNLRGDVTIVH
jgi:peptidoglycan/xylan/chitin deacetylase (PgdA/CDA1 family)